MTRKRKSIPVPLFDMAGLENWLSSMAEQGLYLEKINRNWAYFQLGTPMRGIRYAMDVTGPTDIDRERNENYAQMGWSYVTTLVNLYYVYRSDVPDAPALHTDPVTQSKTITTLIRRLRRTLVLCLVCLLFGFRDSLIALCSDPWSFPRFLLLRTEYALLFSLLLIPCVCLLLIPQIGQLRALRRLRRQLADGIPLDRNHHWPRKISPTLLTCGILLLLILTFAARLWLEPRLTQTLKDTEGSSLPHLTLTQVLSEWKDVRIVPESPYDKMLHPNTFRRSLLVPEQLVWSERGTVLSPDFTNEAWVSVSYYRVRLPRTAPILLSGLAAEYRQELSAFQRQQDDLVVHTTFTINQEFQPVFRSDFDQLLLLEYRTDNDPVTRCYVGRIGAQVFRLVCRGIPDSDRCLALLAGQMR